MNEAKKNKKPYKPAGKPAEQRRKPAHSEKESGPFKAGLEVRVTAAKLLAAVVDRKISLDGMRWVDEGTSLDISSTVDGISMARLGHFGHYLRLRAEMPDGMTGFMLATLSLKA